MFTYANRYNMTGGHVYGNMFIYANGHKMAGGTFSPTSTDTYDTTASFSQGSFPNSLTIATGASCTAATFICCVASDNATLLLYRKGAPESWCIYTGGAS